jgi:hypothetical protein
MNKNLEGDLSAKLRLLSAKLRAMAYLIETHQDIGAPLDMDDILWGTGEILSELSISFKSVGLELERLELKNHRKRS